jgi:tetratricopeptide (TPR) repeat protein
VHQHCGRLDEAQRCFEQALQAHRALGLRRLTGIAQGCQAELLLMLGDGTAALAALDEGEAALREVRDRYELARLLAVRCKAWRAGGDATRAQAALAEAEAVARAIGARPESELERALAPLRDG